MRETKDKAQKSVLPPAYTPTQYEQSIYKLWLDQDYFTATVDPDKEPFAIMMPPPNITGVLHLGHVTGNAIEDALARFERMRGKSVLFLPGTDHAAISTQVVVEEKLAKDEGKTRHDLGREQFLQKVREFVDTTKARIHEQERRVGISADWSRERYTFDAHMSRAVNEAFVRMFNDGLIYRGKRIISWCPRCVSSLSDIEVQYKESKGNLWFIKYPILTDGKWTLGEHVMVATTRPETMLGDTAVAVNPKDPRYKKLIGKHVLLPLVEREIPIIGDEHVDSNFGTGALKVTPAHDMADYEIAQRHNLQSINVIGEEGRMTKEAGRFADQEVEDAREAVVADLQKNGYLERIEEFSHSVPVCERCKTHVQPLISNQWFVKIAPLAKRALAAVRAGEIEIVPEQFEKVYYQWMENIHDWNISRQIWWGHRIPVYTCSACKEVMVSAEPPANCTKCGESKLEQDPDTLDTWFSSGLWTFATLGWPDKTRDLEYWHPTTVLDTGRDILFFWVARMIMMTLYFTGEVPFKRVYLHGLVLDKDGQKMSKSKSNGIDPIEMADKFGMDAVRLSLLSGVAPGLDTRLTEEKIARQRNIINKLWNISRFVLITTECKRTCERLSDIKLDQLELEDQWILHRLDLVTAYVTKSLEDLRFSEAIGACIDFLWNDFADWYLEVAKHKPSAAKNDILLATLEQVLILLHPFVPFVTEVLWQELKKADPETRKRPDLIVSTWPSSNKAMRNPKATKSFEELREFVSGLRTLRADYHVPQSAELAVTTKTSALFKQEKLVIEKLAKVQLSFATKGSGLKRTIGARVVFADLKGHVDLAKEQARMAKEVAKLTGVVGGLEKRLASKVFLQKAPKNVVEQERARQVELNKKLSELKKLLGEIEQQLK